MNKNLQSLTETLISQVDSLTERIAQLEAENIDLRISRTGFYKYFSESSNEIYRSKVSAIYQAQRKFESLQDPADIIERRDKSLELLTKIPAAKCLMTLRPHNGVGQNVRVMILGSGGLGDCLILTYAAALIRSYFHTSVISVAFPSAVAKDIFESTNLVDNTILVDDISQQALLSALLSFDLFDMIIDVRYAAIPFFPPLSRINVETRAIMLDSAKEWYPFNAYDWPHLNNNFAKKATDKGLNAYSIFPASIGLQTVFSNAVLDIEPAFFKTLPEIIAKKRPVACIGVGSDPKMAANNGYSTKTLKLSTYHEIATALKKAGYLVIQLGTSNEPLISHIDIDMRGKTDVRQTAAVLKTAQCFIGTEGGLVHLAKAVSTPSVVCFGPTPISFFSYQENRNITNNGCTDCWWTTREWMKRCISKNQNHSCMDISPSTIVREVKNVGLSTANIRYLLRIVPELQFKRSTKITSDLLKSALLHSSSGLENGNCFLDIISGAFQLNEDKKHPIFVRNNISHKVRYDGEILIDCLDSDNLLLKILNISNLINSDGTLILVHLDETAYTGMSRTLIEKHIEQIQMLFTAKGWGLDIDKASFMRNKGNQRFILTLSESKK